MTVSTELVISLFYTEGTFMSRLLRYHICKKEKKKSDFSRFNRKCHQIKILTLDR